MSIAKVGLVHSHGHLGTQHRALDHERTKPLAHAEAGQQVSLRVLEKLADGRFVASISDTRYIVASAVPLAVGDIVKASVSSVGGIVELKYLGGGQFEQVNDVQLNDAASVDTAGGAALTSLQRRFNIVLPSAVQQAVAEISNEAQHPETMAMGALYLTRLGTSTESDAMHALYAKQVWAQEYAQDRSGAADISALIKGVQQGKVGDLDELARLLGDALEGAAGGATCDAQDKQLMQSQGAVGGALSQFLREDADASGNQSHEMLHELARRLLNTQDAGALAYHFGSLPVMVANQMLELDLVLFRERQSAGRAQGLRKLVMTLRTETLGKVEIVAQSFDTHLSVSIGSQSAESIESLAGHAQEIRELLGRLGWKVDGVSYRLSAEPARAAERIVTHVLSSGSLDAVI